MAKYRVFKRIYIPSDGWISYFRTCFNMRQSQLGKKLKISQPGVKSLERSEKEGGITLASLRKVAEVFDCDLIYAFVPRKSIRHFIDRHAMAAARKEAMAVDHTMALEGQGLSGKEVEAQTRSHAEEMKKSMDKKLWD